ncbi:ATP-binding protein [Helicobacter sp. MIT 00-7814]|uniref:dynamin family protein n=1 Tax=unclassified Helicobacter TaxID=2593540 RepID=UPI000E1E5D83|nr:MULTISPECIES: dynamin family protein [unclassified Helicobacter]RDU54217.1 ATP-binding protein [Helicobacter sp. MIT 00-7814]RDU56037.1 ATP-binding protein [Helicobacter sp. MIT 99-10781]
MDILERFIAELSAFKNAQNLDSVSATNTQELQNPSAHNTHFDTQFDAHAQELQALILQTQNLLENLQLLDTKSTQILARLQAKIDSKLKIAVIGQFSSGKSTFLNALFGEEFLPSGIIPLTSKVCEISYGKHLCLEILYKDGSNAFESLEVLEQISPQENEKIASYKLFAPIEILKEMSFFDTPGFNSQNQNDTDTTNALLEEVDGVIWLSLIDNVGKLSEKEILNTHIKKYSTKALCVLNQKDRLKNESEVQTSLEYAKSAFSGIFSEIVAISAKDALESKRAQNLKSLQLQDQKFADSNMQSVLDFINGALIPLRESARKVSIINALKALLLDSVSFLRGKNYALCDYEKFLDSQIALFASQNPLAKKAQEECLKVYNLADSLLDSLSRAIFAGVLKEKMEFLREKKNTLGIKKSFFVTKEVPTLPKDTLLRKFDSQSEFFREAKKITFKELEKLFANAFLEWQNAQNEELQENLGQDLMDLADLAQNFSAQTSYIFSHAQTKLSAKTSALETLLHTNFSNAISFVCAELDSLIWRGVRTFSKDEKFPLFEPSLENIRELLNRAFCFEEFLQKLFLQNNIANEALSYLTREMESIKNAQNLAEKKRANRLQAKKILTHIKTLQKEQIC